ncbi:MAG: GNAT family N-acetyltransferase [Deltaproteobacteria bacterium]|nr:GNAT family N-acetyltransferase [Deltaproteobacteria bacterium]
MKLIRKARKEDREQVIGLLKQFPQEEIPIEWESAAATFLRLVVERERYSIFVAEENGRLLGVVTMSYPEAIRCCGVYTCIEEFIVAAEGRGKGIGGKLLAAAIEEASSRECYELQVNNPSVAGYPVYLKYDLQDLGKHLKLLLPKGVHSIE